MKIILLFLLSIYKSYLSKPLVMLFGNGCRYEPTCSVYSKEAIEKYGALKGGILSIKRIMRCHPFSKHSHFDPVPSNL